MSYGPDTENSKTRSRNKIYQLIYRSDGLSKPEIAHRLGISLPTVIQNVKYLQGEGLVRENGILRATGGRNAVALSCVKDARCAVGLDITQNHISIVLVNLGEEILANTRLNVPYDNSPEYLRKMGKAVGALIEKSGIDASKILGAGVSVPGILSENGRMVLNSHAIPLAGKRCENFEQSIGLSCVLCNDANAAGIAEIWNRPGVKNLIYLSLSNTVGGSIIFGNKICTGENQRAGEFGHIVVERGGRPCYCGKKGCLDAYCSAGVLSDLAGGSVEAFFKRLKKGEPAFVQAWDVYLGYLLIEVNNLRMAFDCNVILGGYVGAFLDDFIEDIRGRLAKLNTFGDDGHYLTTCRYRKEAAAVGAALLQIRPFIDSV